MNILNLRDAMIAKAEQEAREWQAEHSIKIEAIYAGRKDCDGAGPLKENLGRAEDGNKDIYMAWDLAEMNQILEFLYHEGNAEHIKIIFP